MKGLAREVEETHTYSNLRQRVWMSIGQVVFPDLTRHHLLLDVRRFDLPSEIEKKKRITTDKEMLHKQIFKITELQSRCEFTVKNDGM